MLHFRVVAPTELRESVIEMLSMKPEVAHLVWHPAN
jgi:hypothetical protein